MQRRVSLKGREVWLLGRGSDVSSILSVQSRDSASGNQLNSSGGRFSPALKNKKSEKNTGIDANDESIIEVISGFDFADSSSKVKISGDGRYVGVAGKYKPGVKVFEVSELSQKFERGSEHEVVDFEFLSSDDSRLAMGTSDRTVSFFDAQGLLEKVKVPLDVRVTKKVRSEAQLVVGGSNPALCLFDLERGRLDRNFRLEALDDLDSVNAVDVCETWAPLGWAGSQRGQLAPWDLRCRSKNLPSVDLTSVPLLQQEASSPDYFCTSLAVDGTRGFEVAVGLSDGRIALFDVRSSQPLQVIDLCSEDAVRSLEFHGGDLILCDSTRVYSFRKNSNGLQDPWVQFNSPAAPSCVTRYRDSGLLFYSRETPEVGVAYIPSLGSPPPFARFLHRLEQESSCGVLERDMKSVSLDQELDQEIDISAASAIFPGHAFVTRKALFEDLKGKRFLGTPHLKPYLHGFFLPLSIIEAAKKAVASSDTQTNLPTTAEIRQHEDPSQESWLQSRLLESKKSKKQNADINESSKKHSATAAIVSDQRFAQLLEDPSFAIQA